jgi:Cu-processing system ATP-binding protein
MPQSPRFPEHLSARHVLSLVQSLRAPSAALPIDSSAVIDAFDLRAYLDRPLGVCSGGQRQRVNAAVAFLFDPDVLVLDEPTAGLDPVSSASLKDRILGERNRGCAVLITSHVLSELEELADDVVFLLEGRVHYSGSLDSLRAAHGGATLERAIGAMMQDSQHYDDPMLPRIVSEISRVTVGGAV